MDFGMPWTPDFVVRDRSGAAACFLPGGSTSANGGTLSISAPTAGWHYQIWGLPDVSISEWRTGAFGPQGFGTVGGISIYLGPVPGAGTLGCGRMKVSMTVGEVTSTTTLEARTPGEEPGCPPMQLTIPEGAPAGTYSGTVTLVTSAGPGS